ncbi:Signal transducer regulating beta-lactamase production, contains metallopeptidase domain [Algoriphagus locisalis]|uniref:Signal transducer regulating beta-lactamase production, contains metallopeptidase domain n=1 Tax=Algoriphagus locisalis TaxID=305507 RepID=A0A1I7E2X4_9BACT|nr:M56 family metallopeptidase [Algoriphagus locisalis]SFU18256.1 Signal transducer regulating beta-lactamase production, contains metallopeptidase domain [Algoriphagus locisalis]
MIVYLLKSIACLLLLLLVHRVLLQREVLHRFNRFFLLFSVVASFLIPLYTIEVPQEIAFSATEVISEPGVIEADPSDLITEPVTFEATSQDLNQEQVFAAMPESQFNWEYLLFGLYGLISLVFLFRFARNIKVLVNKIQRNIKIKYRGQTLVLLKEESLPFSFLKYIFVAESDLEDGKFTDAVFAHESTHIQEKHSWDNLFIEALLVPFWFHPGLHWAKASIKLNHEFIADQIALRSTPLEKYESQLLAMMLSEQKYGLASSLNFSLTKKRFEMMKRKSKNSSTWIKVIALVPILGALVYFFSERVAAQADDTTNESEVYVNNTNQKYLEPMDFDLTFTLKPDGVILFENENYDLDAVKELISETKKSLNAVKINLITDSGISMGDLSDFQAVLRNLDIRKVYYVKTHSEINLEGVVQEEQKARLYSEVRFLVEDVQMNYFFKNYSELTDKERSMLLSPPLPPPGIKEDGTVTPSFEHETENEDSKIPHIFFTPDGDPSLSYSQFTESYVEEVTKLKNGKGSITITPAAIYLVDISNYANPADYFFQKFAEYESLRSSKPHYVNKSRKDQAIMDALFFELTALSYQFSEEIRSELGALFSNQYSPLETPILPYVKLIKDGELQYKKRDELNDVERHLLPPPHPPLPSVWETTKPSVWEGTKPSKHVPADKQSSDPVADQKVETADKWPPGIQAAKEKEHLESYNLAMLAYEELRNQAPHFVKKNKAEQEKLTEMFSELASMYYQMSFFEKAKLCQPSPPFAPYLKLESNGEVYYKLAKDLTAEELEKYPPPPPPLTPADQIEDYKKVSYQYELMRNKGRNDASLSMEERNSLFLLYNELQLKFLRMGAPERRQVKMVNFPYYRVEENGKNVFKAVSELTPEQRALNNC